MTVRFVNWSPQQLLQETKQALEKARLYAKSKDGQVTLYYSTKPRSLRELITGEKAKAARNALRGLLGRGSDSAEILSSIEKKSNTKHALRQNEVTRILTPIFQKAAGKSAPISQKAAGKSAPISQKAAGESVPIFQETAGESAIFQKAAALDMQEMGPVFTPGKLQEFLKKHTVAALSEKFWDDVKIQSNCPTLGSGLALVIIDRIIKAKTITDADVAQLTRALDPYTPVDTSKFDFGDKSSDSVKFVPLPQDLKGTLTNDKLSKILASFYSRYVAGDQALNFCDDMAASKIKSMFKAICVGNERDDALGSLKKFADDSASKATEADLSNMVYVIENSSRDEVLVTLVKMMNLEWNQVVNETKPQVGQLIAAMSPKKSKPA